MSRPRTFDAWIITSGISITDPGYGIAYVAWHASEQAQADVVADCQKRLSLAQAEITRQNELAERLRAIIESAANRLEKSAQ